MDIIGLEGQGAEGRPLLKQVVSGGRIIAARHGPGQIQDYARRNLEALGRQYKRLVKPAVYPVTISRQLKSLISCLSSQIRKRQ